jgi:hypothetical protein
LPAPRKVNLTCLESQREPVKFTFDSGKNHSPAVLLEVNALSAKAHGEVMTVVDFGDDVEAKRTEVNAAQQISPEDAWRRISRYWDQLFTRPQDRAA